MTMRYDAGQPEYVYRPGAGAVGILGHSAGATFAAELVARDCATPDAAALSISGDGPEAMRDNAIGLLALAHAGNSDIWALPGGPPADSVRLTTPLPS